MIDDIRSDNFIELIRERLGDRYEFSRELMGGGMSRVFVAREVALDREVVVKFLPTEIAAEANRDRFRREIQMAARLSHPHIAPLFSAAEDGELLYYTMPFIRGESLRESLAVGRQFSISEVIEILQDVADALAYAHRAGIVHRDIKPANVLREGDHAVITDFGVAKAVRFALGLDSRSSVATTTGVAIGTPAYMAPEQIAGDASADHRVDIYALGLLGYELLTGVAPFRASSPQAQLAAQLTQVAPPIQVARPDTPPVLAVLLARCLEKDASRRPPTAESVLEVLRAVSSASGGTQFATPAFSRPHTRLLVAGIAIAAIGAVAYAFRGISDETPRATKVASITDSMHRAPAVAAPELTPLQKDSIRRANEVNARRDARLLALLRDSISNAVHRSVSDSIAQVRAAESAAQRSKDSSSRAARTGITGNFPGMPQLPPNLRGYMPSEAFVARAHDPGPPRRVGVSVFSGIRNASQLASATVLRDSIVGRLRGRQRYVVVAPEEVQQGMQRSRNVDSLRAWTKADMWVTIYALADGSPDSTRLDVTLRDFSAHSSYTTRSTQGKRMSTAEAADPKVMASLVDAMLRELEAMDRAPRRESAVIVNKG